MLRVDRLVSTKYGGVVVLCEAEKGECMCCGDRGCVLSPDERVTESFSEAARIGNDRSCKSSQGRDNSNYGRRKKRLQ